MKTVNGHIQVYSIWINGREKGNTDNHYPIDSDIHFPREWSTDLRKSVSLYSVILPNIEEDDKEIYEDYHVALYSIDINVNDFESMFDMKFDIEDDNVQGMIPHYVDYDFNTVAERTGTF